MPAMPRDWNHTPWQSEKGPLLEAGRVGSGEGTDNGQGGNQAAMKGYRTPSWFRMKGIRKKAEVKVQRNEPKTRKSKRGQGR